MNILQTFGSTDKEHLLTDRPTVKVLIERADDVLVLNKGLLPGGGIDPGESHVDAITRELQEELGARVRDLVYIGTVIQYRSYLGMKYEVHGYSATLDAIGSSTNPQDEGEAHFTLHWMTPPEAVEYVAQSIASAQRDPIESDVEQGRLFNLMTTHALLKQYIVS